MPHPLRVGTAAAACGGGCPSYPAVPVLGLVSDASRPILRAGATLARSQRAHKTQREPGGVIIAQFGHQRHSAADRGRDAGRPLRRTLNLETGFPGGSDVTHERNRA
jgi:hypothetical protein